MDTVTQVQILDETDCIYIVKEKLATAVEDNPKAPFSIATTPRCREGHYSFPCIAPLYPWSTPYKLNVKQGGIQYHFLVFGMTRPRIEPWSPGPLPNTIYIANVLGTSSGVMVSKQVYQTHTNEVKSHWVPLFIEPCAISEESAE